MFLNRTSKQDGNSENEVLLQREKEGFFSEALSWFDILDKVDIF